MAFGFSGNVVSRAKAVYEADTRDLERGSKRAEGQVNRSAKAMDKDLRDLDSRWEKLGKSAGLTGKAIGAGLAVAGPLAAAGLYKAVKAASDLGESVNAVKVVFGDAADKVLDFSKVAATEAGLSMRAFNELVTPVGASLINVGFSADAAAEASINLTRRAADMASVFNVDVKDALAAIQAGLRGEADPLERFGVGLSAAAVEAKALELGLAKTAKELDANEKAQARLALIMAQTNRVAGDFKNTSGSLANQQRIATQQLENLAAAVGQALLPVITSAIKELTEFLTALQESGQASEIAEGLLDALRSTFNALEQPARNTARVLNAIANAVGGWEDAFQLILAGTLAAKVRGLAGAFTALAGTSAAAAAGGAAAGAGGAASRTALLLKNLRALTLIGAITIGINLLVNPDDLDRLEGWLRRKIKGALGGSYSGNFDQYEERGGGAFMPGKGVVGAVEALTGGRTKSGRVVQLPTSFKSTHPTTGLAGFPAIDIFAQAGTPVLAPEDGRITRVTEFNPDPRYFGNGIYFVGTKTGNTYYIKHVMNPAPVGAYKKGDRIAVIARGTAGGDHAHVGLNTGGSAAARGPSTSSPGELDLSRNVAPASEKAKAKTAPTIRYAEVKEVREVASKVRFAYRRLEDIPADAAKKLRPGLAELTRILGKPVTAETLREVERQAEMYMRQVGRILEVERVADRWKGQRARLQRLLELDVFPPEREAKIRKQIAVMDAAVAQARKAVVPTPQQLALIKRGYETMAAVVEEGLELAREAVDAAREKFDAAWGRFTDQALAAFDAQTQRLLAAMRVRIRSVVDGVAQEWEFGQGVKTPSELILEAEESARSRAAQEKTMQATRQRVEDANAAVLAAQAEGGEKLETALAEQQAARSALEDMLWQERRATLTAAAAEERRIAEGRLTEAQQVEQARRDVLRGEFQAELVELGSQIVTRKLSYDQALGELQKLFGKYELPFEEQGAALSTALAVGMNAALGAVEEAVNALKAAIEDLNAALDRGVGKAKGKLEELDGWERALQARSQGLNERYGLGGAAAGAAAVGGGGGGRVLAMAAGAEVSRRTLAWIGEAGREWVVPEGKIPPALRPSLVPLLRRIIRGSPAGRSGVRGFGGLLELAGGGEFGGRAASPVLFDLDPDAAGGLGPVRAPSGSRAAGGGFTQINQFLEPPRDAHAFIRRSVFAARAAL